MIITKSNTSSAPATPVHPTEWPLLAARILSCFSTVPCSHCPCQPILLPHDNELETFCPCPSMARLCHFHQQPWVSLDVYFTCSFVADDSQLYAANERSLTRQLGLVQSFSDFSGFKLNVDRTQIVTFATLSVFKGALTLHTCTVLTREPGFRNSRRIVCRFSTALMPNDWTQSKCLATNPVSKSSPTRNIYEKQILPSIIEK